MNCVSRNAYAKINVGLDILRRRENGYHEVYMVMQSISLHDVVTIQRKNAKGITLTCSDSRLSTNQDNLIFKAAKLFYDTFHITQGVNIHLEKNIPIAAGMAGGSTDAASTLILLNELFDTKLSMDELCALGLKLGADVPFCIVSRTSLAEGIGEKLTPLDAMPDCKLLIIKPPISVSTKYVYENLHVDTIKEHPNMQAILDGLKSQNLQQICSNCENILEHVTASAYPEINKIKEFTTKHGAMLSLMSGSGPTVFGVFDEDIAATKAYDLARETFPDYDVFLSEPLREF